MKRVVQFVVLAIAALLVVQPVLAYTSCSSLSCTEQSCPPVCCADMSSMHHDASVASIAGCNSLVDAMPANPGCGQPSPSSALITREMAPPPSGDHSSRTPAIAALFATSADTSLLPRPAPIARPAPSPAPDRGILFHLLRI